jgi:hypothetical protein
MDLQATGLAALLTMEMSCTISDEMMNRPPGSSAGTERLQSVLPVPAVER